jgi:hypothetical protein
MVAPLSGEESPTLKVRVFVRRVTDENVTSTELAFWIFLLDQGPEKRYWFTSWEYRLWSICSSRSCALVLSHDLTFFWSCLGCIVTILGMPLTTLAARHDIVTVRVVLPFSIRLPFSLSPPLFRPTPGSSSSVL